MAIAIIGGLVAGVIVRITGTTHEPYEDSVEFTHTEGPEAEMVVAKLQARIEALENNAATPATAAQGAMPEFRTTPDKPSPQI
jgi:ammonium transporter Rh